MTAGRPCSSTVRASFAFRRDGLAAAVENGGPARRQRSVLFIFVSPWVREDRAIQVHREVPADSGDHVETEHCDHEPGDPPDRADQ